MTMTTDQWIDIAEVGLLLLIFLVTLAIMLKLRGNGAAAEGEPAPHPILAFLYREPAMLAGFVGSAATLLAAFGLDLSAKQIGAVIAFASMALAVVVRQSVVSQATVARSGLAFDPKDGKLKRRVKRRSSSSEPTS